MTSDTNRELIIRVPTPLTRWNSLQDHKKVRGGGVDDGGGGGALDRLLDKCIKGETQRETAPPDTLLATSSPACQALTQTEAVKHTAGCLQHHGGDKYRDCVGDEGEREGEKKNRTKGKSWLRDSAFLSLSR